MKTKLCFEAISCVPRTSFIAIAGVATAIIAICLICNTGAYPQGGLSIGDKVPEVAIKNILTREGETVMLSSFRGKLVIIDFWATWCSPCVAMLPKTDSLQRAFQKDVQFLAVTYQPAPIVTKLLTRSEKLKNIALPFITGDSILRRLFPHKELPHYVWIDSRGVVKAITGHHEVTASNIRDMLKNDLKLVEKRDYMLNYDREKPLLLADVGIRKEDLRFETVFTTHATGLSSRFDIVSNSDGSKRITVVNGDLRRIASVAFGTGTTYFGKNRIVAEVKDSKPIIPPAEEGVLYQAWKADNTWCYELIAPPHLQGSMFSIMQQDVARLFPQYTISLEKRIRPCLVLERTSGNDKIATSGKRKSFSFDQFGATLVNCSLNVLITQLNVMDLQHLPTPVIDGTNYTDNVDIELPAKLSDVNELRQALKAYHLDLIERPAEIEVIVIRDRQ